MAAQASAPPRLVPPSEADGLSRPRGSPHAALRTPAPGCYLATLGLSPPRRLRPATLCRPQPLALHPHRAGARLSLIHISEPTRLDVI
eukprot:4763269-Prorocentrum_lima.AAC.1